MNEGPALVAIDLGAESCRVSLLQRRGQEPEIRMVRRFANGPREGSDGIRWNLTHICDELEAGLQECAQLAPEGIASIGVTGWAVDYVRLDTDGRPLAAPFCYRDTRNTPAMDEVHKIVPAAELYSLTGVQIQPINTIYQLYADKLAGVPASAPWINLPEYILHWLGAPRIAEYTNATHTGLVDPSRRQWSQSLFERLGLTLSSAPELVAPGTELGGLRKDLARLPAFAATRLIAPACHDTASAIAGIPLAPGNWAYISSGTWSLIGMLLAESHRTDEACARGFTNLGAAGGDVLFHRGIPGMWLLRQCMNCWDREKSWSFADLIAAASRLPAPHDLLDLDDPAFLPPGDMPGLINAQRLQHGAAPLAEGCDAAPQYANLIFYSLAHRYADLLRDVKTLTGREPERICVVGGGSRNDYLASLTSEATGLPVERGSVESSTIGNFAMQWARLEQPAGDLSADEIAARAGELAQVPVLC